jgi:hypothetical protein
MAAGLGFKDFATGEVLTAADVDGYLMQGVWVFASATARDAAVTSPQEGNFAYLKDTNVTTYYTGSAWANLDTTGMTNPMTTTGDTIYSSSGSTPARLGIGTAGQVLQVNSGATAPEWATPAGGGGANWSLLNAGGTALTGAQTITVSGISGKDKIMVLIEGASSASASSSIGVRFNTDTGSNYYETGRYSNIQSTYANGNYEINSGTGTKLQWANLSNNAASQAAGYVMLSGCNSSGVKVFTLVGGANAGGGSGALWFESGGYYNSASTISSVSLNSSSGNFDNGTVFVYTSA